MQDVRDIIFNLLHQKTSKKTSLKKKKKNTNCNVHSNNYLSMNKIVGYFFFKMNYW